MTRLCSTHPVIAPDLPGAGHTPNPGPPLSVADKAEVLREVITTFTTRAIVLGHSAGGQVATELAARHPGLVERLLLVSPGIAPDPHNPLTVVLRWLRAMAREPLDLLARGARDVLTTGTAKNWADFHHALTYPLGKVLGTVDSPVLVIRGRHDPLVPARWARQLADTARHGDYREIPGRHALPYTTPGPLAQAIADTTG